MQAFLLALADALGILIGALQALVFVNWLLWLVGADPANGLVRLVRALVEPPQAWLRLRLPFLVRGAWDLSPMALLLVLMFLDAALPGAVRHLAIRF
jgi:uncharacterized protein YggT (Ycf19 family)